MFSNTFKYHVRDSKNWTLDDVLKNQVFGQIWLPLVLMSSFQPPRKIWSWWFMMTHSCMIMVLYSALYTSKVIFFFQCNLQMLMKSYSCLHGNMKEQQFLRQKDASKDGISLAEGWEELFPYAIMKGVGENQITAIVYVRRCLVSWKGTGRQRELQSSWRDKLDRLTMTYLWGLMVCFVAVFNVERKGWMQVWRLRQKRFNHHGKKGICCWYRLHVCGWLFAL